MRSDQEGKLVQGAGNLTRRRFSELVAGGSVGLLSGCASQLPVPPEIPGEPPANPIPWLKPVVLHRVGAPARCIDVHGHFFNATDVPVRGFLEGPIANEKGGEIGKLIKSLAGLGQLLAFIPPTAGEEYKALQAMSSHPAVLEAGTREDFLKKTVDAQRQQTSREFFRVVRNTPFEGHYNDIIRRRRQSRPRDFSAVELSSELNSESLADAMVLGGKPRVLTRQMRAELAEQDYPEGVLAFIGCMLSPRWMNIYEFARAYSSEAGAFGIDQVFGVLVDFDRWLEPTPRSGQLDQIKLHQYLSALSGGYMRPLVGYNPWSDWVERGGATTRVVDAVLHRGFVGAKLYPPNGFRPYGNTLPPATPQPMGGPTARELDDTLDYFWDQCAAKKIPVMAHAGSSFGSDDAHNALAGPPGWEALLTRRDVPPPILANVGHFGGDADRNGWTEKFSSYMGWAQGSGFYADIGYWNKLHCLGAMEGDCKIAHDKLVAVLRLPNVSKRVMYGSDWHMLAQERDWWRYPFDIAEDTASMRDLMAPEDLFAGNAVRCFASTLVA